MWVCLILYFDFCSLILDGYLHIDLLFSSIIYLETSKGGVVFGTIGSHIRIEESLSGQESDKKKVKPDVGQPSVHMVEGNKVNPNHQGKGVKRKFEAGTIQLTNLLF